MEEVRRLPPCGGCGLGVVKHLRLVVVEGVAGVLVEMKLGRWMRCDRGGNSIDLVSRDVGIGASEVKQDGTVDPIEQFESTGHTRPVIRDGYIRLGARREQVGQRSTEAEPKDARSVVHLGQCPQMVE